MTAAFSTPQKLGPLNPFLLSPPPLKNLKRNLSSSFEESSSSAHRQLSNDSPSTIGDSRDRFAISRAAITRAIMVPDIVLEDAGRGNGFRLQNRSMVSRRHSPQVKVLLADLQLDLDLDRSEAFEEDPEVQELGSAFSQVSHSIRKNPPPPRRWTHSQEWSFCLVHSPTYILCLTLHRRFPSHYISTYTFFAIHPTLYDFDCLPTLLERW